MHESLYLPTYFQPQAAILHPEMRHLEGFFSECMPLLSNLSYNTGLELRRSLFLSPPSEIRFKDRISCSFQEPHKVLIVVL